jgi:hypothetical protein
MVLCEAVLAEGESDVKAIFQFVEHIVMAMVKGFIFTGVVVAVLCFGAILITTPGHSLSDGIASVFAIVATVLAAFLGSAVALIYHLSHIEEIHHALKARAEQRQRATT